MKNALRALLQIVGWIILGPFVLVGITLGIVALCIRLMLSAMLEGFEWGYTRR